MFERDLRVMSVVKRWAIVPTVTEQNNAEHSFYVAMYANDMAVSLGLPRDVTLACVQGALWHDVDEVFSGDFPGPHKKMYFDMEKAKATIESLMDRVFGISLAVRMGRHLFKDSSKEKAIIGLVIKAADVMDALLYMTNEVRVFQNREALEHHQVLHKKLNELIDEMAGLGYDTMPIKTALHKAVLDIPFENSRLTYASSK